MVFKDLPVGAGFSFGGLKVTTTSYQNERFVESDIIYPLIWKKTALDGLSVYTDERLYASYDYPHMTTGVNRYMRAHGHRFFFLTSLYRYLNCGDASWRNVAIGDDNPYVPSKNDCGFLSCFNEKEIAMMQPFTMKVDVPAGYTKQYGAQMTKEVLVGLPSLEQIGARNIQGTFGVDFDYKYTWVTDADTTPKYVWGQSVCSRNSDRANRVMPVIRVRDDAPVDTDDLGRYVIRYLEPDFDGDIDALLGFAA